MAPRVLLVDDDEKLVRALQRTLDDFFDISTATSGCEALQRIRTEGPYSVIVSDMKMPGMDGVELVQKVHAEWPETPCIILTGNQDVGSLSRVDELVNAFQVLNKPSPRSELVASIEAALASVV